MKVYPKDISMFMSPFPAPACVKMIKLFQLLMATKKKQDYCGSVLPAVHYILH